MKRADVKRIGWLILLSVGLMGAGAPLSDSITPQLNTTVTRGLAYLARQQQPDGSFTGFEDVAPRGRTTATVLLAMLSAGQTPTDGRHALVIHNAVGYLLRESSADGYFGQAEGSGMSGQDWITLALAEMYGMEGDAAQRAQTGPLLREALAAIVAMQDRRDVPGAGGWNEQGQGEGNLATTALTMLALDGLSGAGLEVPSDTTRRAVAFARSCQHTGQAGFADKGQQPTAASTAAGACILLIGHSAKPGELKESLKFALDHKPAEDATDFRSITYQVTLAYMLADDADWAKQWKAAWDVLRKQQGEDGSWLPPLTDSPSAGGVTATSEAMMTLTVPYRLLPVYGGNGQ